MGDLSLSDAYLAAQQRVRGSDPYLQAAQSLGQTPAFSPGADFKKNLAASAIQGAMQGLLGGYGQRRAERVLRQELADPRSQYAQDKQAAIEAQQLGRQRLVDDAFSRARAQARGKASVGRYSPEQAKIMGTLASAASRGMISPKEGSLIYGPEGTPELRTRASQLLSESGKVGREKDVFELGVESFAKKNVGDLIQKQVTLKEGDFLANQLTSIMNDPQYNFGLDTSFRVFTASARSRAGKLKKLLNAYSDKVAKSMEGTRLTDEDIRRWREATQGDVTASVGDVIALLRQFQGMIGRGGYNTLQSVDQWGKGVQVPPAIMDSFAPYINYGDVTEGEMTGSGEGGDELDGMSYEELQAVADQMGLPYAR